MRLVAGGQFDTIYHEHYSYLSLHAAQSVFRGQQLVVFDVEELPTHGGSLRLFVCHADARTHPISPRVQTLLHQEREAGMLSLDYYGSLRKRAERVKSDLLSFLIEQKRVGRIVAGYGAAAKGNTLLNYAGIRGDLLPYVCDAAPSKQGRYLPGSHIPILHPDSLKELRPNYVLIMPWNLREEIVRSVSYIQAWGGRFVLPLPELTIL
jgi:hypothetical protein